MVQGPPPGPPTGPLPPWWGNRCLWCGGSLYATKATGQPQQEDHEPGCKFFGTAVQVMQYANELKRASAASGGRYLRRSVKELSAAACASDPVRTITTLARKYSDDAKQGTKQAEVAEMLSQACQALAQGKKPAPVTLTPR